MLTIFGFATCVNRRWVEHIFLAACLSLCASILIFGNLLVSHEQQYVRLAESFLNGKLYFVSVPEHWHDTAQFGGQHYWPLGPLPAVLIIPLVSLFRLFGATFYLGYVSLPISLLIGWMCFQVTNDCGRSREDSLWLMLAFCGASSYLSVAAIPMSWPFAHVVAILFLFMSLHEWVGQRRWWLLGVLMGFTAAARITAGLNIVLFAATILFADNKARTQKLAKLAAGMALPLVFLGAYNFARFGSVWETGYNYQPAVPGDFSTSSLANIIPHLQIFLFGPPTATEVFPYFITNPFGMSVLICSPWLLYLGSLRLNRFSIFALLNCLCVLLAILTWRSTGQIQLGYRFILDFLPIVIFLLARDGFHGQAVPLGFKVLTTLGFLSTLYFLQSFIKMLPQG